MARSSANLVLRYGELEIKIGLFKTYKHQPVPETKIHGKCGNEISHKFLCPKCSGLTEVREVSSSGKAEKKAAKKKSKKKVASKKVGPKKSDQPPVLGTPEERPLKAMYCVDEKCGGLLEGLMETEPYCSECDVKLTKRDIARRFKLGNKKIQLPTKVLKAVDDLRLGSEMNVLDVRPRTQVPGSIYQGDTYLLAPGKGAEYHFLVLKDGLEKNQQLCLFVALKISNEYCGVITFEKGRLFLTLLYPKREIALEEIDFGGLVSEPSDVEMMCEVLKMGSDSSTDREEFETLDTPANHLFHSAVAAQEGGKNVTPRKPSRAEEQALSMTAQLMSTLGDSSKEKKAASKAAKKKSKKKTKKKASAK